MKELFNSISQVSTAGGIMLGVIIAFGAAALFIFLAKMLQFRRDQVRVRELLRGLYNVLQRDGFVEALTLCDTTPGPVSRLLAAGIRAIERCDEDILEQMDKAALEELPKLESHIAILGTIAYVLPALGVLGCLLTLMDMLHKSGNLAMEFWFSGVVHTDISACIVLGAASLALAIPVHIGYNYLVTRVDSICLDMEKAALELFDFVKYHRETPAEPEK